jgi:hypothetical protein
MNSRFIVAAAFLASSSVLFAPTAHSALGAAQIAPGTYREAHNADRPRGRRLTAVQGQPQIACTVLGCMTVPAACHPIAGKTSTGVGTGYDVIVCPPGIWPLK